MCFGCDVFGSKNMGIESSIPIITSELLLGSSSNLSWASSVELWCKGHGVQDRLTNNSCVVNEKAKASKMQNPKHNGRRLALNYVISYGDLLIPS